ncbi:MAG TPA: DUF697 domain-containing protein [Azospirillum sp.]
MASPTPGSLESSTPNSAAPTTPPAAAPAAAPAPAAAAAADGDIAHSLAADSTIKTYVIASVAASVVPVPLFDIAAIAAVQFRMIQKLSQLYGRPFSDSLARNIIASLAGSVLGYGVGATVAISLAKIIPGVGWAVGMVSLPVVAGGATYALGRVFVRHYEDGGSIFDLNTAKMKAYYAEQFEKGKLVAEKAKADLKARKAEEQARKAEQEAAHLEAAEKAA